MTRILYSYICDYESQALLENKGRVREGKMFAKKVAIVVFGITLIRLFH
jgi:hypothetical protein